MIFDYGLGGGAKLNFSVKAYSALPEAGKENEIAVITDTPISRFVFSSVEPESVESGLVWIDTSGESVSFSATKDGSIILYPATCRQWNGEAWEMRGAHIRQGGAWVLFAGGRTYLFNNGIVNQSLTGGINAQSITADSIHYVKEPMSGGSSAPYTTANKIDLSGVNSIHMKWKSNKDSTNIVVRLFVDDSAHKGSHVQAATFTKHVAANSPFDGTVQELVLDVSDISDSLYVGYAWAVLSDANQRNVEGDIYEIWVEGSVSNESEGGGGESGGTETTAGTHSVDVASETYRYTSGNTSNPWLNAGAYDTVSPRENYVGHKSGETNTMLIPVGSFDFSGRSTKLRLTFSGYCPSVNFYNKGFRWAICSSSANKAMYQGQSAVTGDEYQLANGTAKFSYNNGSYTTYTVNLTASNLPSGADLFVFIWPNGTYTDVAHIKDAVKAALYYIPEA